MALNSAQLIGTGLLDGFRNRIINGDMRIDQRNNGATTTYSGPASITRHYNLDRWDVQNGTDGAFSVVRSATAPTYFTNSFLVTCTTADASITTDQSLTINQVIEGTNVPDIAWGTASAKPITVSFWVRSSVTGTFSVSIRNDLITRSYVANFTISAANTWQYKTITIPGDTAGTWNTGTGAGLVLTFALCAGPTLQTSVNTWTTGNFIGTGANSNFMATLSATFYITGVQLEVGSVATEFERRSYGTELALCQRYFYVTRRTGRRNLGWLIPYTNDLNTSQDSLGWIQFPTVMRATPSGNITVVGDGIYAGTPFFYGNALDGALYPEGAIVTGPFTWSRSGNGGTVFSSAFSFSAEL